MTPMPFFEGEDVFKVELKHIAKSFGGVKALKDVTLQIRAGEIHALVGENGAGKSTLMKILAGAYRRDGGVIMIDGREVQIQNTRDSRQLGIGIIYQEFSLVPELSVAENIFLDQLSSGGMWLKWNQIKKEAGEIIRKVGFHIDPGVKVKHLSIAQQQVVEISKALAKKVDILILDEPSAVLGPHEIKTLFEILKKLKTDGVAIIYISHRLEEIFAIADRVTVLRNGISSESHRIGELDNNKIISLMLGRSLDTMFPPRKPVIRDEILRIEQMSVGEKVKEMSFSVRAGEILGIAGLVGSGRTETLQAIFGVRQKKPGSSVVFKGASLNLKSPREAVQKGIGMIPEDRKRQGVITSLSIEQNINLTDLKSISGRLGFIKNERRQKKTQHFIDTLRIKATNGKIAVGKLSGGNQQKVVFAKWLNRECDLMLIDEPTRGVDVGAKVEIYEEINKMADQGKAVVVVSSETAELLGICDRILVMHDGVLRGELTKDRFSEENVLRLAIS